MTEKEKIRLEAARLLADLVMRYGLPKTNEMLDSLCPNPDPTRPTPEQLRVLHRAAGPFDRFEIAHIEQITVGEDGKVESASATIPYLGLTLSFKKKAPPSKKKTSASNSA